MTLEEINSMISILIKNKYFNEMLDENNPKLDQIYDIAKKFDRSYLRDNVNVQSIKSLKVSCNNIELINIIRNFYRSLNIPDGVLDSIQKNIIIKPNLNRAFATNEKIYLGPNNGTLEYMMTIIHEVAHCIRFYSRNNKGLDTGLIAELEAKEAEEMFYKYLIEKDKKIIVDSNNDLRSLNNNDVKQEMLFEMENEKNIIKRAIEECEFIKVLKNNMHNDGSYQFTQDSFAKALSNYGPEKISRIKFLKYNYLSDNPAFIYSDNYDVGNGKHLTNEFRFVFSRLITVYLDNTPYQDKFGEYLLSGNLVKIKDVLSYYNVNSIDELVSNQENKYNLVRNELLRTSKDLVTSEFKSKNLKNEEYFDQRSKKEIEIANHIKEKNIAIKEKKEHQLSLEKPKIKTLNYNSNSGSSYGFINILMLIFIVAIIVTLTAIIVYNFIK